MTKDTKPIKTLSEKVLFEILNQAGPQAPRAEQVVWLEHLAAWLLDQQAVQSSARFRYLTQVFERKTDWSNLAAQTIWNLINESSCLELFVVLPNYQEHSFLGDAKERIFRRLLPGLPKDLDLRDLSGRIFNEEKHEIFFRQISVEVLTSLWAQIPGDKLQLEFRLLATMSQATLLISTRLSAEGLSSAMRERLSIEDLTENPFFQARTLFERLHRLLSRAEKKEEILDIVRQCEESMRQCQALISQVFLDLEKSGVSIDLVYRLEGMNAAIERLKFFLPYLTEKNAFKNPDYVLHLLDTLVGGQLREKSLKSWFGNNLHLVARKIVEHSGDTGEHYVSRNAKEARQMFFSAAGGGVLTTFTAVFKFLISWAAFPLFPESLALTFNYAGSFILMHIFGLTLATKQPSMTASTLARKIKDLKSYPEQAIEQSAQLVTLMSGIIRTQFLAALGNILFVVPGCLLVSWLCQWTLGRHFLNHSDATYTLQSLNPASSLTIVYAALTGVLLWMGSLCGGWVDNWAVYRKIFNSLEASSLLQRTLGPKRTPRAVAFLQKNLAALSVNVALGLLLAFTPLIGKFTGLPLDVRHVTLSTGFLTLAITSLGPAAIWSFHGIGAVFGIIIIGLCNFGVSFILSLVVACRAHQVPYKDLKPVMRSLYKQLRHGDTFKSPFE